MPKYIVTLDAEIYVEVEADDEFEAESIAENSWQKEDVETFGAIAVDEV